MLARAIAEDLGQLKDGSNLDKLAGDAVAGYEKRVLVALLRAEGRQHTSRARRCAAVGLRRPRGADPGGGERTVVRDQRLFRIILGPLINGHRLS